MLPKTSHNCFSDNEYSKGLAHYLKNSKQMDIEVVEAFLKAGADPHTRYRGNRWLLNYPDADTWSSSSYIDLINICKRAKSNRLCDDDFSMGLAHYLDAKKINLDVIAAFFAAGAHPETKNKRGKTLLQIAATNHWVREEYLRLIKMCSHTESSRKKRNKSTSEFFSDHQQTDDKLDSKPLSMKEKIPFTLFKSASNKSGEVSESESLLIEY